MTARQLAECKDGVLYRVAVRWGTKSFSQLATASDQRPVDASDSVQMLHELAPTATTIAMLRQSNEPWRHHVRSVADVWVQHGKQGT